MLYGDMRQKHFFNNLLKAIQCVKLGEIYNHANTFFFRLFECISG